MPPTTQHPLNSPVFAPQLAYLTVEQQPTDSTEAQRLEQLRQLIEAAPDTADLREFAEPARQLLGPGYCVHCGSSHVWIKRDDQPERLAIVADRYTTAYREWDIPLPTLRLE
ncbi:hypothetical protein MUN82_22070 (plasmid) [Hymenobacter aerilatus]|uniref:Uncharacterized protein n=2 Tax=Hymenobacter TaxID=89966 RepID=A0A8T9T1N1_9BACT|nr:MULTISPECIES: hypothetical protein [Hymenobacter]MBF9223378.1 hypothetical protein [Hymenobacter ruricola]UOR07727.1 hypothetical protein MUN82_22070 [Hymenobacter aerilatus]